MAAIQACAIFGHADAVRVAIPGPKFCFLLIISHDLHTVDIDAVQVNQTSAPFHVEGLREWLCHSQLVNNRVYIPSTRVLPRDNCPLIMMWKGTGT